METKFRTFGHGPYQPMYRGAVAGGVKHRTYSLQKISTESHWWWRYFRDNPEIENRHGRWGRLRDTGGPFTSQKIEVILDKWEPQSLYRDRGRYGIYDASAVLYPDQEVQILAHSHEGASDVNEKAELQLESRSLDFVEGSALDSYGATAISRVQPTQPVFDGASTIAELFSERKFFSLPGNAGGPAGQYLNYQLGVAPTVGGIEDLQKAVHTSAKVLRQLERDSGRLIRRRYEFPEEVSSTHSVVSKEGHAPPFDVWNSTLTPTDGSTLTTVTTTAKKIWFSGAFCYYLPKDGSYRRRLRELDHVYGINPGVDTAWELYPFSFVADYFTNIGDVVGNLNSFASDGLVMPYGYIMCTQKVTTEYTRLHQMWIGNSLRWVRITGKVIKTTLQRRQANPFGFGLSDDDLSLRQMSILAALGISRR